MNLIDRQLELEKAVTVGSLESLFAIALAAAVALNWFFLITGRFKSAKDIALAFSPLIAVAVLGIISYAYFYFTLIRAIAKSSC